MERGPERSRRNSKVEVPPLAKKSDGPVHLVIDSSVAEGVRCSSASRAENGMFRYEQIIGDRLRAKRLEAQTREAAIAVNAINRMTELGMPESVQVSA